MQYTVEDLSPIKKKIVVTVPAEEVDASIGATIAMYRTTVKFDGFRKGKAPASMVESRFHNEIYQEATTELVNLHINQIVGELNVNPVSRIDFDGKQLQRGEDFTYSISFEVMPEFEVPAYEGFAVEQEETVVNQEEVDRVLDRLRGNAAEVVAVGEVRNAKEGDIAVVDFAAFDENGEPVPGIKAENFHLPLGESQTLPDFEALVYTLKPGDAGEGPVSFPADFFNPEFAGKTVTMKVTLHGLQERKLPELDDALAQKMGGVETVEKLRETISDSYRKSREDLNKATAQKAMLDGLLKLVDFPVPESMTNSNIGMLLDDMKHKLERQGKSLAVLGKTEQELVEEMRPEAEMRAKAQILLIGVARKLELVVTEQEVDLQLRRIAMQSGQDYNALKEYYIQHNLIFALRDRILADKAMEAMFEKAAVTMVAPRAPEEAQG